MDMDLINQLPFMGSNGLICLRGDPANVLNQWQPETKSALSLLILNSMEWIVFMTPLGRCFKTGRNFNPHTPWWFLQAMLGPPLGSGSACNAQRGLMTRPRNPNF